MTVRAATSSARSPYRPLFSADSLMCSYWRCSFSPTPLRGFFLGITCHSFFLFSIALSTNVKMPSIHALIRSFSDPWKLQTKQMWLYSCSLPFCEGRCLTATLHTVEIGNSFHKMQNCLLLQYAFCSGSNDEGIVLFFRHLYSSLFLTR